MSLRTVLADTALPLVAARPAGTYASGPIANPGAISNAVAWVYVSAVGGGGTHLLDVTFQTSPDNSTWTSVTGGGITQMSAVGSAVCYAGIADMYVQVLATVSGTSAPTVTFKVDVMVIPGS